MMKTRHLYTPFYCYPLIAALILRQGGRGDGYFFFGIKSFLVVLFFNLGETFRGNIYQGHPRTDPPKCNICQLGTVFQNGLPQQHLRMPKSQLFPFRNNTKGPATSSFEPSPTSLSCPWLGFSRPRFLHDASVRPHLFLESMPFVGCLLDLQTAKKPTNQTK